MTELIAPPMPSVAPWCNADDVTASMPGFTGGNATIVGVDLDLVTAAATLILYRLSGRQYRGVHTSFVRPKILSGGWRVLPYPYGSYSYGSGYGFGYGGWWGGGTLGAPGWDSPCPPMDEIILQGPVLSIIEVLVDGVPLVAGQDYQLYDHRRLVRSTPTVPTSNPGWPQIQDLSLPVTLQNTWGIGYQWGQPPPPDGRLAAIELSCQLALGLTQNAACRLPPQVTNLTREGVTAIIAAPLNYIEKGLTGLPACDLFLMSANPKGEHRRRRVASPDQIVRHTQGPF